jgi:hypothetical protein
MKFLFVTKVNRASSGLPLAVALVVLVGATVSAAFAPPMQESLSSHIGLGVGSQPGAQGGGAGAFAYPRGVAVETNRASAHYGDVYVADTVNSRVQELSADGQFVSMFGWDVNETRDRERKATQAQRNVCTETEIKSLGVKCKAGVAGDAAGQLDFPSSIAVDPASGDLYVQEISAGDYHIDRFSADGRFIWRIGKEVNETEDRAGAGESDRNLCVAGSGDICGAGRQSAFWSTEHGAFNFIQSRGNLLAFGPEHLLYVGDQGRVQEFKEDGTWVRELPLRSISSTPDSWVTAIAVDESGNLYLLYPRSTSVVRKLNPKGEQVAQFEVAPSEEGAALVELGTLALDPVGGLVVSVEGETGRQTASWSGALYDTGSDYPIAEFAGWGRTGISFNGEGELYAAALPNAFAGTGHEVLVYTPVPTVELVSGLGSKVAAAGGAPASAVSSTTQTVGRLEGDEDDDYKGESHYDSDDRGVRSFGHAASAPDRRALTALVQRYYAAAAAENGAKACNLTYFILVETIPEDYARPVGPRYLSGAKTCQAVLSLVFEHFHTQLTQPMEVTGVRVSGNMAYVLLGWTTMPAGFMEAKREGKAWKIDRVLAAPLP